MSARSDSPTFFHGQPWSSWIERIGRDKPLSDDEPECEPSSSVTRLSVDDIDLYGFCPERDTFYGVVCEICNAIVKPQALIQHMECRHPSGPGNLPPPSTPAAKVAVKTPYCKLSKLKKSQLPSQLPLNNAKLGNHAGGLKRTASDSGNSLHAALSSFPSPQSPEPAAQAQTTPGAPLGGATAGSSASPVKSPGPSKRKRLKTERSLLKDREYDPDRHCGVWIDESAKPCTRSLTCKAHTVSLRRTVAGRSKSFDKLLAEHRAAKELPQRQPSKSSAPPDAQTHNSEPEMPGSPPVLSLPDTYPLPQAVDLLYRSLAPHGSTKPNKLEDDFVAEELRLDAAALSSVAAPTVAPPVATVLPSLSPLPAAEEPVAPVEAPLAPPPAEAIAAPPSQPSSALYPPLTAAFEYKVPKFEHEHLANGKRIVNCGNGGAPNSVAQLTLTNNNNGNSSPRNKCEFPAAPESFAIQLEATATSAHFSDISWSNCHPEPLAVSRWLRLASSRKQYNFNIH